MECVLKRCCYLQVLISAKVDSDTPTETHMTLLPFITVAEETALAFL
jgi:hypothetical protein